MGNKTSIIFTILSVVILLGTVTAQSEDSLVYFSSELEIGYEYIWDISRYVAPTFLEEEITEEHNITITIIKEIDLDIATLENVDWETIEILYEYFLLTIDGINQTIDFSTFPEELPEFILLIIFISNYIIPVVVMASNGEISNQFDTFAENFLVIPDEEYVIDGDVVTYKLETGGDIVSKYIEKQFEYSTGLLLYSNVSDYGENGLISQYIKTLTNNTETEIVTETQIILIPTSATEIGFLPFPSTWVSIIGIIAVFSISKRKKC